MQYMSKELIEKELKREEHLLGVYKNAEMQLRSMEIAAWT